MKTELIRWLLVGAVVTIGLQADQAAADEKGPYLSVDVGYARNSDVMIKEYGSNNPMLDLDLDSGPRFSVGAGYRLCRWFGVGIESGLMEVDWELSDNNETGGLLQVPIMANMEFRLPNKTSFKPYAGFSVGGALERIEFDRITDRENSDVDWVFVWQAYAGIRYQVFDKLSVGVAYKYLRTGNANWNAIDLGTSSDFRLGSMKSHTISASAIFEF